MSKSLYYAEQSMEQQLRQKHLSPLEWDAFTLQMPATTSAVFPSARGAGMVPPSSYYSADDGHRLLMSEAAEPASSVEWKYIIGAALILYLYSVRR